MICHVGPLATTTSGKVVQKIPRTQRLSQKKSNNHATCSNAGHGGGQKPNQMGQGGS